MLPYNDVKCISHFKIWSTNLDIAIVTQQFENEEMT